MSLPPVGPHSIPEETVCLARTICPKGTLYMHIRDQLGAIYEDQPFADLFSRRGQPAEARLSAHAGLHLPVHRGLDRSTSCRSRSTTHRLEVCVGPRVERPRL